MTKKKTQPQEALDFPFELFLNPCSEDKPKIIAAIAKSRTDDPQKWKEIEESFDVVLAKIRELPAVKAFLDVLQRATLRRKLEVLAGYYTSQTGALVA